MDVPVRTLIKDALGEIGAGPSPGEDLDGDDAANALRHLIRMVDAFQGDRCLLETAKRWPFATVASQATRTIGPTGNYVVPARPIWISDMRVIPAGDTIEFEVIRYDSRQEYYDESLKALTELYPRRFLYERTSDAIGTITFWPVPTQVNTLYISIPEPLQAPVDLNTVFSFRPGGYYEAWHLNLAKRCVRTFERATEPANLRQDAEDAYSKVLRLNEEVPQDARADRALTGTGGFDIRSGRYR